METVLLNRSQPPVLKLAGSGNGGQPPHVTITGMEPPMPPEHERFHGPDASLSRVETNAAFSGITGHLGEVAARGTQIIDLRQNPTIRY